MKKTRRNKRGLGIKTIVLLVVAGFLLYILLVGSDAAGEMMRKLTGGLAGTEKTDPACEPYRKIDNAKNLTDLIVLVSTGECGGDTTETAFRFNVTALSVVLDTENSICGTRTYSVRGLNRTITFGDIEKRDGTNCDYNEDSWPEDQDCAPNDADLVISAPEGGMSSTDTCVGYGGLPLWCYEEQVPWWGWPRSHLHKLGISGLYLNQWAIKRAGEDVVICEFP